MESNAELDLSKRDLLRLSSEGELPPKMQIKLRYLLNSIEGGQVNNNLLDGLPQFQKISLQLMDMNTRLSLFNSIVRCLAGRQVIIYFSAEKATLKTQSSEAPSVYCYLFGDSKKLRIAKNKEGTNLYLQISMEKLMVSKIYRQEKKKHSFGISYDGVKYRIRFQEEGACARIHGALLGIIRQKRNLHSKITEKEPQKQIQQSLYDEEEGVESNYEQSMVQDEKQYLRSLKEKVNEVNFDDSDRFQLLRNTDYGKILVNRKENEVRILMFEQKCTVGGLIQSYIQFSAWNTQVDSFRVINKIRRNTYFCSLVLKRQKFTAERQAYIMVSYFKECPCLSSNKPDLPEKTKERHYLLLNSVPTPEDLKQQTTNYPFTINQTIQFCKVQEGNGVFINLQSKIDFNVYEYFNNSLDKSLAFLGEIGSITLLSRERDLLKNSKKELFQFNLCICEKKIPSKLIFQPTESQISEHKKSICSDASQVKSRNDEDSSEEWPLKLISQILDNHNNKQITEKRILEFMSKKVHERYYLKQLFDLQPNEEPYAQSQYHLSQRPNFFELGTAWKVSSSEQVIFIDEQVIKVQKGALKLIVKQITSNLMAGKSIMSMSLPVELFSDDSALEGFARTFGFIPYFMAEAVKKTEVVEQIKYVSAAFMFILIASHPRVTKPFNPILGETYQATVGGIPIYFQQISHHPPISAFYMKTEKFEAHGNFDLVVDLGMNSAYTKFLTPFIVKIYHTNTEYIIRYPDVEVGGIMFGDRTARVVGKAYCLQKNSGIYLQHSIGKPKKGLYEYKEKIKHSDLAGGIFQISPEAITRLLSFDKRKSVEGIKPEDAMKKIATISGKWYGDYLIDGVLIKSFKDGPFPLTIERPSILLPSDCTYRLDIIYRRWRDFKKSNQEKEVLENLQRRDRKLREKHNPKQH